MNWCRSLSSFYGDLLEQDPVISEEQLPLLTLDNASLHSDPAVSSVGEAGWASAHGPFMGPYFSCTDSGMSLASVVLLVFCSLRGFE